ncbi:MAG: outer membrane beta-barrel protein [Fibromonadaceae bacterium]|jgi:hypothetical protein|nr:outer membrane beta-barrel protein [Fibromonadaceae bacterium]
MKTQLAKIAFAIAFTLGLSFAQEAPERLAVYVYGANEAGINKSLSSKLLTAMAQNDLYMEIGDPVSFQDELAKNNKSDLASIIQVAKRYGSDYVCAVNVAEIFGTHSITGRLIKIAGYQVVKTGSVDHSLKSLEDLTKVSSELASQLLPPSAAPPAAPPAAAPLVAEEVFVPPEAVLPPPPPLAAVLAPVAAQKQCAKKYNINELLSKIKDGFPTKLKDCSSTLAKDMLNPFGKKLEPKSFMTQCPIEGIKKELPEGFPNTDKILVNLTNFTQGLMNSTSAGGALDPKKLVSAVGSMNVEELLSDVKKLATDECIVDEPYSPPVAFAGNVAESNSGEEKDETRMSFGIDEARMSFGIRAGLNYSHTYAEHSYHRYGRDSSSDYGAIGGMQLGFVLDIPTTDWFYIQPGLMYVQKGRRDDGDKTAHYLELPLLLSLKFFAFRLGVGPYFSYCLSSKADVFDNGLDIGLNYGLGFDVGMFYIGTFYEYGFANMSSKSGYKFYNRTFGFNLGVNL